MREKRRSARVLWVAAFLLTAVASADTPVPLPLEGRALPHFTGKDLFGQTFESSDLRGKRALILAMTSRGASDQMHTWVVAARERLGQEFPRKAVISLKVPFIVSERMIRAEARKRVPQYDWDDTFIEKNGEMAQALNLPKDDFVSALVVDERGVVVAVARGPADSESAAQVWNAAGAAAGVGGSGPKP